MRKACAVPFMTALFGPTSDGAEFAGHAIGEAIACFGNAFSVVKVRCLADGI
ncbi:hypothetical protein XCR_3704 [Xanthomonas campestris pv. raphani 756C]|nr:hypothetical protein XCR_3704 [Xanthomonas campestris pv. raphani 756C]